MKANKASMIWATKNYKGKGYGYDINSAYPNILADQKFLFPIKKGVFKKLTQKEFNNLPYLEYGIYRCKISGINDKLMRKNPDNYYTHYCLNRAKELGYKIVLINDNQPNFLSYAGKTNKVNGDTAFKQYVKELYELKEKFSDNTELKQIFKDPLNIIWGALCEKVKFKKLSNEKSNIVTVIKHDKVISMVPLCNGEYFLINGQTDNQTFNTPFARLGPFLLARMRVMISKIIEPHLKSIVRVHTDGIISKNELTFKKTNNKTINSVKIGNKLGDLKYEGCFENIYIKHVNKVIGYK